jgi:DNA-binding transcriptional regulator YhcF (GntR family)
LNVFVDFEQLKEEYEEFRKRLNNFWKERSILCMNEILTQEKSIYLQIAEMIETDILRDILLEEERVPSTNELAKLYAINPATAAKGVNILVDEGVLYKKRGIGMFVSAGAKEAILSRRKNEFYDNYVKKLLEEAASIGLGKEEVIQLIQSGNEV